LYFNFHALDLPRITTNQLIVNGQQTNKTQLQINENDKITLICNASGSPTPKVNWTLNGDLINVQGEKYEFNAVESKSGNYSCIAYNGDGNVTGKTFGIKIKG
jgi:membrane carboxypeptidase/penicillin-binding protein PbpC